jgi:hypothetical protein
VAATIMRYSKAPASERILTNCAMIICKRMTVTPPLANQKECFKFVILDFGITIPCLP